MTEPIHVRRIVHAIHVVRDLAAARRRYMDVLGAWVFAEGYFEGEDRDMNLMYAANFMLEPMSPRSPSTVLGRYLERYGEGLQSIEFEVDDLAAALRAIEAKGVRVPTSYASFFIAHPKDTFGIFYEVTSVAMPNDPYRYRGWSPGWIAGHPSTLERLACITFVLRELDGARDHLRDVWGARVLREDETPGLQRSWLSVGGSVLCLARPTSETGPVAGYLRRRGPGMYSVVWKVERLSEAARHVQANGLRIVEDGCVAGAWSIAPEDFFGARFEFTDADPLHAA